MRCDRSPVAPNSNRVETLSAIIGLPYPQAVHSARAEANLYLPSSTPLKSTRIILTITKIIRDRTALLVSSGLEAKFFYRKSTGFGVNCAVSERSRNPA